MSESDGLTFSNSSDENLNPFAKPPKPLTIKYTGKPKPKRAKRMVLRTMKIRALLRQQSTRPDPQTYARLLDLAKIPPPPVALKTNCRRYEQMLHSPRLASSVRRELSELWDTRKN